MRLGGADKPALVVGAQTLLGSVVSAVTTAGAALAVVVGPERPAALSGGTGQAHVRYAREEPPGGGPVAALRRGLTEVSAPAVVLAAADLPFLRPGHIARLLAAMAGPEGHGAVQLDASGRPQWLLSCWPAALLSSALAGYTGSSLRGLLGPLQPVLLRDETGPGEPPAWLDCDTADDLRLARDWAARHRVAGDGAAGDWAGGTGREQEATR
jgi:molybdopterin-guanine dinucleotide biosynthesis protein A